MTSLEVFLGESAYKHARKKANEKRIRFAGNRD
jgi:hypothetical protein